MKQVFASKYHRNRRNCNVAIEIFCLDYDFFIGYLPPLTPSGEEIMQEVNAVMGISRLPWLRSI